MRLAQRARACPACGARALGGARWCGDCGSGLTPRDAPVALHVGVDEPDEVLVPTRTPARRLLGAGLVVLALVAGAGLVADPGVTGDPDVLGRLDEHSGRSSLLPPVDDLKLLWRMPQEGVSPVPVAPPQLVDLGDRVLVGGEVVDLGGSGSRVAWSPATVPSPDGAVLFVDGDEVVVAEAVSGKVMSRAAVQARDGWTPGGAAVGWVAGLALLTDVDGVLGAVRRDGEVVWVGDPRWEWDGTGHGTDWAVVTATGGATVDRVLVVDGRDGSVERDVGPAGSVHAPVVHGATLAWVDPFAGVDRGLGAPVEVHAVQLGGSGRSWAVDGLPPTSGVPQAVRTTATSSGIAVHYWTAGQATTATWLDPVTGAVVGTVAIGGTGMTPDGWPVATVVGDAVAHVDPVRRQVRVVDLHGVVRWSIPARAGEGLVADGDVVLVHTSQWRTGELTEPPRGSLLQTRLRLLDVTTGDLRWDRFTDDMVRQRFVGTLDGAVGVAAAGPRLPLAEQSWHDPASGRRRSGPAVATRALGVDWAVGGDVEYLGRVAVGADVHPLLLGADGRLLRTVTATRADGPTIGALLVPATRPGGPVGSATLSDGRLGVVVGGASVTATVDGRRVWRTSTDTALRPELAVLLEDVVVLVTVAGDVLALDRGDGSTAWRLDGVAATALSAGGDETVVGTADGRVLVVDAAGDVLQAVRAGRLAVEDVAVLDGRVLATVGAETVGLGRGRYVVEPEDRVEVP